MSSTEEMDVYLTTDSDTDEESDDWIAVPWGYRRTEAAHAFWLINGFYNKYPHAKLSDDYYRGRETYDKLSTNQRVLARSLTERKVYQLTGIYRDIYDTLISFDFLWWLETPGGFTIGNPRFLKYVDMVFRQPVLLQCQLFLKCYSPQFQHHLELHHREHPGRAYEYKIWRRLRMVDSLRSLQFYNTNEHWQFARVFLLCIEKSEYGKTWTIDFFKQHQCITSMIAQYLLASYVKTMY